MAFFKGPKRSFGGNRPESSPREYGRAREGGDRGGFGGSKPWANSGQMFPATCSNCNKACEVPFQPNGSKPVYCKDCFGSMKGSDDRAPRSDRGDRPSYDSRPSFTPRSAPASAPANDETKKQIDVLTAKVDALAKSLDYAVQLIKGTAPVSKKEAVTVAPVAATVEVAEAPQKEAKKVAKPAAKLAKKAGKK
jgi:CxxC-x17-CxxC domain-containing protein